MSRCGVELGVGAYLAPGNFIFCGSVESNTRFHFCRSSPKSFSSPEKNGRVARVQMPVHVLASIQSGSGFSSVMPFPGVPMPEIKNFHSCPSTLLSPCMILMVSRNENSILCASKRERQMFWYSA